MRITKITMEKTQDESMFGISKRKMRRAERGAEKSEPTLTRLQIWNISAKQRERERKKRGIRSATERQRERELEWDCRGCGCMGQVFVFILPLLVAM
jgi:hypothetical protein